MTFKQTPIVASLCAALTLGAPLPVSASAPEGDASPTNSETKVKLALVVDTKEIDEEFRNQLELITTRQLRPALEQAGYEVAEGVVDLALRVRFTPVENGQFRDHAVRFELIRGRSVESAIEWVLCNACGQAVLEKVLADTTPKLMEALHEKVTAPHVPDHGSDNGGDGDTGDGDGDTTGPLVKPIGPLGISGAVIAGVGLGALVGGVVELSRGEVRNDDPTMLDSTGQDHGPPGRVLVGVGAGALAVGVVMLGVDLGLRAKKRKAAGRTSVLPVLGPTNAGLVLQGQF